MATKKITDLPVRSSADVKGGRKQNNTKSSPSLGNAKSKKNAGRKSRA